MSQDELRELMQRAIATGTISKRDRNRILYLLQSPDLLDDELQDEIAGFLEMIRRGTIDVQG